MKTTACDAAEAIRIGQLVLARARAIYSYAFAPGYFIFAYFLRISAIGRSTSASVFLYSWIIRTINIQSILSVSCENWEQQTRNTALHWSKTQLLEFIAIGDCAITTSRDYFISDATFTSQYGEMMRM